jgi:hypothetical protein
MMTEASLACDRQAIYDAEIQTQDDAAPIFAGI